MPYSASEAAKWGEKSFPETRHTAEVRATDPKDTVPDAVPEAAQEAQTPRRG